MAKKKDKEKTADSSSEQAKTGLTWQTVIVVAIIVIVLGGVRWWLSGSDGGSSSNGNHYPTSTVSTGGAREIPRPARKATVTHKGAVGVFRSAQGDMRSMSGYWTASGMRVDLWCEAPGFCTWSPGGVELEASLLPEEGANGRVVWTGVVHHPDEGWLKTEVKL